MVMVPRATPPPNTKKLSIGTLRAESCEQFSFGTGLTFASGETVTVTHTGKGRSVYLSGRIEEDDDFDDGEDDFASMMMSDEDVVVGRRRRRRRKTKRKAMEKKTS